jgi:hypothetical protein
VSHVRRNSPTEKLEIKGLPLAERIVNEIADAHLDALAGGATVYLYEKMVQRVSETLRIFGVDPTQRIQ